MRIVRSFLLIVNLVGIAISSAVAEETLVMGYPEREKLPLIEAAPSNAGVFEELFREVAHRVGAKLEIRRAPKRRLYAEMANGTVDFYPSAGFAEDRAAIIHWIDNGLQSKEVCLTRRDVQEITRLEAAPKLRLVSEAGGVKIDRKRYPNIAVIEVPSYVDMELAVRLLTGDRGDLYIADMEVVDYFMGSRHLKSMEDVGLKLHAECLGRMGPTFMGFARHSTKFAEVPNPSYKPNRPIAGDNQPSVVSPDSLAGRMAAALLQMKKQGETKRIYERYTH